MFESGPKRKRYMMPEQKEILLEFMANHPMLRSGKFSTLFSIRDAQRLWQELAHKLNKIPGPVKDWRQWRKTWQDLRSAAKIRGTAIRIRSRTNVGSAPKSENSKSQVDQNAVSLAGSTTVNFQKDVRVPEAIFNWDNPTNEESGEFECLESDEEVVQRSVAYENNNKQHVDPVWQTQNIKLEIVNQEVNKTPEKVTNGKETETTNCECKSSSEYYKIKSDYYKKKLKLLEREVKAKEQLSESVKTICQIILENLSS